MREITKADLIGKIQCLRQDIESVVNLIQGNVTLADSWDIGDEANWNAVVNLLDDIEIYLDEVTEGDEEDIIDVIYDDVPPEDIGDENDDYKIQE